ncbi:hypothetical protein BH10BAC3_BH10BAC3_31970 [soil metagenome]
MILTNKKKRLCEIFSYQQRIATLLINPRQRGYDLAYNIQMPQLNINLN